MLATTLAPEVCADTELLQVYHEQHTTVEPGFRWIKNPVAISPVWLKKPAPIAALAMLTVIGVLVYAVIQRQVRSYLRDQNQQLPGNKGSTATPTAAVVFSQFALVTLVQFQVAQQLDLQVHGWQEHHRTVCNALGIDYGWYMVSITRQNSLACRIPPCEHRGHTIPRMVCPKTRTVGAQCRTRSGTRVNGR